MTAREDTSRRSASATARVQFTAWLSGISTVTAGPISRSRDPTRLASSCSTALPTSAHRPWPQQTPQFNFSCSPSSPVLFLVRAPAAPRPLRAPAAKLFAPGPAYRAPALLRALPPVSGARPFLHALSTAARRALPATPREKSSARLVERRSCRCPAPPSPRRRPRRRVAAAPPARAARLQSPLVVTRPSPPPKCESRASLPRRPEKRDS